MKISGLMYRRVADVGYDLPLDLGCLVTVDDAEIGAKALGIGKLIETSPRRAVVEWFSSIGTRTVAKYRLGDVERAFPVRGTRCYVRGEGELWRLGRISGQAYWHDETLSYPVELDRQRAAYVSEAQIYVRCLGPGCDPAETLMLRAHDDPFWHRARSGLLRQLITGRAAAQGLTGLLSSRVKLYPHQVEVVRRVLHDPVQRYLLADEVGLGKTIEAGAIIRQTMLDDRAARALVIVPPTLKAQWRVELEERFFLFCTEAPHDSRVTLCSTEELEVLAAQSGEEDSFDIVVMDEAHHIAAALAMNPPLWERCRHFAHASSRLLLLSATPALNHEADFLAMLHLLEPGAYQLDDVESFRDRVRNRQEIGHFLLMFQKGIEGPPLYLGIAQLRELCPDDAFIQRSADELEQLSDLEEIPRERADALISSIRLQVCETYRIHRRMLRTSRAKAGHALPHRTRGEDAELVQEYSIDERAERLHDLLLEWRTAATDALRREFEESGNSGESVQESPRATALAEAFAALVQCSGTWALILDWAVQCRLQAIGETPPDLDSDWDDRLGTTLPTAFKYAPTFEGEASILAAILEELSSVPEDGDDVDALLQTLQQRAKREQQKQVAGQKIEPDRVIVFCSSSAACREIVRRGREVLGENAVYNHLAADDAETVRHNLLRFKSQQEAATLVCDASGEEGLNFQFANLLIHFDLPWEPNRLEQRIGRLDRIGRIEVVESRVWVGCDCPHSIHEAWFSALHDGLRIFHESIAALQFFVDGLMPKIKRRALWDGAPGVRNCIAAMQETLDRERKVLLEQSALDEIEAFDREDDEAATLFQSVQAHDAKHDELRVAVETWVLDALKMRAKVPQGAVYDQFGFKTEARGQPVVRYEGRAETTLPSDLMSQLESAQDGPHSKFGVYSRRRAGKRHPHQILRLGHPFIDLLMEITRWDDRGQAFASWRYLPDWMGTDSAFFRLDFIIEADPVPLQQALRELQTCGWKSNAERALLRRADTWLAPTRSALLLDLAGQPVTEDVRRVRLAAMYRGEAAPNGARDYDLFSSRWHLVEPIIAADRWPLVCQQVRGRGEKLLRHWPAQQARWNEAANKAEQDLKLRLEQLRRGLIFRRGVEAGEKGEVTAAVEEESLLYNALIEGIRTPRISLDAMGFIVLSNRNPFC